MRKFGILGIVVLAIAVVAGASNFHRQKIDSKIDLKAPKASTAAQTIDYLTSPGWTWGAGFYFGNLFHPTAGWYPLQIQSFDVVMKSIDGATTGTGVVDRVVACTPAGAVIASAANVPGVPAGTWANIPLPTPVTIASGDFIGFVNQPTPSTDKLYGGSATGWNTSVSREPQRAGGGSAAAMTISVTSAIGVTYTATLSAAAIRANIDTNVPVELMAFSVE